jgi:hypothetical protein
MMIGNEKSQFRLSNGAEGMSTKAVVGRKGSNNLRINLSIGNCYFKKLLSLTVNYAKIRKVLPLGYYPFFFPYPNV